MIDRVADLLREIGRILLEDDRKDIGKFDRLHHWHLGVILIAISQLLKRGAELADILDEIARLLSGEF